VTVQSSTSFDQPLVSILTPVYNGADFLGECIESVLAQTYQNFEYIIVNNCSTDRSLEIALDYAEKDKRLRVHSNEAFVGVIENHNIAFRLISPEAKYCKVVCADDFLFPDYLSMTIEIAEANPSVGVIGSYQLSGAYIRWQGFDYPRAVIPGRELCRRIFLGGDPTFGFGTPTSLTYRADLVRKTTKFYPNPSPHADTSACFKCLNESDFGFVHQVLSYERIHDGTQTSASARLDRYSSAYLNDLRQYGPSYLDQAELDRLIRQALRRYYNFLAVEYILAFRKKDFWNYHQERFAELGYSLSRMVLLKSAASHLGRELLNPVRAMEKLAKRLPRSEKRCHVAQVVSRGKSGSPT
jgi:glycosyltransferase involved in cell wall biosynthesis